MNTLNRPVKPIASESYPFRSAQADACGKAIIIGEHAVVYGARAVAMPLTSMRIRLELEMHGPLHQGGSIRLQFGQKEVPEHLAGVVADACQALDIPISGLDIKAQSSVLIGAGLGSSASLCIAILRVLAQAHGIPLSAERLAQLGNQLEKRFHGNPSGLDTAVVACEDVVSFVKGLAPERVKVRLLPSSNGRGLPWSFALIDTGVRSSTMAMIKIAASYFQGDSGRQRINDFDSLSLQVIQGLAHGQSQAVASAMNAAALHLAAAGVVNQELAHIMHEAREVGVLAVKPTGSGGGGCALALLDPLLADQQLSNLRARLGTARVHGVQIP